MDINLLHFSHPEWLFGLLFIPFAWLLLKISSSSQHNLEAFIDKHLLPFLLKGKENKKSSRWISLAVWSVVWACLVLALAGPRLSFREVDVLAPGESLVIALDLSESMNADDVKPSRLKLAKLKIEDLINSKKGVKLGLIAFAKDPHMIAPLTDDKETIRSYLPSISTDLVHIQGSRLTETLAMAANMLEAESGGHKSILLISDGGFEDSSALSIINDLQNKGIKIHVVGMGTPEGALLKNAKGNVLKKSGTPVLSKLEQEKLIEISKLSKGRYFDSYQEVDILKTAMAETVDKKTRIWDEHFYLFLLPALPFFLLWFRRGYITYGLLLLLIPTSDLRAFSEYFKNSNEHAKDAFDEKEYEEAAQLFDDCYQKGVCYYKLGDFKNAEAMFKQEDTIQNTYNLGNSLAKQMTTEKLQEALIAYDDVLARDPEHVRAKENREIVKKLLEEQEQKNQDNQDQNDQKDDKKDDQQKDDKQENKSDDSEQQDASKQEPEKQEPEKQDPKPSEAKQEKDCKEQDADLWLNRIQNDPKTFLKNKFQVESMKNGTKEAVDPW